MIVEEQAESRPCFYYMKGQCRFGNKCKFSHDLLEVLLIRHGQSIFNSKTSIYEGQQFLGEKAKQQFQLDPNLIDCSLNQEGRHQAGNLKFPKHYFHSQNKIKLDIIFVSPLLRALETAQTMIAEMKITPLKVIVLPQITEVLSKVCDFSGGLEDKIKRFKHFDFKYMHFMAGKQQQTDINHTWQDGLVDSEYQKGILQHQKYGLRYMKILEQIFPTPLQNSDRCFKRCKKALEKIKKICKEEKAEKILIISHNRILKYMDGRYNGGRAKSFANCEIRSLIF